MHIGSSGQDSSHHSPCQASIKLDQVLWTIQVLRYLKRPVVFVIFNSPSAVLLAIIGNNSITQSIKNPYFLG